MAPLLAAEGHIERWRCIRIVSLNDERVTALLAAACVEARRALAAQRHPAARLSEVPKRARERNDDDAIRMIGIYISKYGDGVS